MLRWFQRRQILDKFRDSGGFILTKKLVLETDKLLNVDVYHRYGPEQQLYVILIVRKFVVVLLYYDIHLNYYNM